MSRTERIPAVVLFAPTACGKTALTRTLFGFGQGSLSVLKGRAEIISADSVAVYRGLDIGTAKPDAAFRAAVPHHLIDVRPYTEPFSVADFVEEADAACDAMQGRGMVPFVVGGTGFYIRNFLLGLPAAPRSEPVVRAQLQVRLAEEGTAPLYAELCAVDAASARNIHPNDAYRICRALEVYRSSGTALSSYRLPQELRGRYSFCTIVLLRPRAELYGRIDRRVSEMLAAGLEAEADALIAGGACASDPGMKGIGYREFFLPELSQLSGGERTARLSELIRRDTRKYAKKQQAFMRGIPGASVFSADDVAGIAEHIDSFLRSFSVIPRRAPADDI